MNPPAQMDAAAATTKLGCTICGGSVIASWVAENHDLLVGVSALVGISVAVGGFALQVLQAWKKERRDRNAKI